MRRVEVVSRAAGMGATLVHTAAWYRMNATRAAVGGVDTEEWTLRRAAREAREREERLRANVRFAKGPAAVVSLEAVSLEAGRAALRTSPTGSRRGSPQTHGGPNGAAGGSPKGRGGGRSGGGAGAKYMAATGAAKARRDQTVDGTSSSIELGGTHFSVHDSSGWAEVPVYRSGSLSGSESVAFTIRLGPTAGNAEEEARARAATAAATRSPRSPGSPPGHGGNGTGPPLGQVAVEGRVQFEPTQQAATLRIALLPDDLQQASHSDTAPPALTVHLSDPSIGTQLGKNTHAAVRVLDGLAPGVLCLDEDSLRVNESASSVVLTLRREDGSHGAVSCLVSTKDGTAVAPADYESLDHVRIDFQSGQTEKQVSVPIHNDDHFEGDEHFQVIFSDATGGATFSSDCDGGPDRAVATVVIECDDASSAGGCDAMLISLGVNADLWQQIGADWLHQVEDAVQFDGTLSFSPSGLAAVGFFALAVPWRLVFALAPPPRLFGGWACFLVALVMIGGLTALVGDFASLLGCCMGISKSVTAITFVALGTSLPDTFASMKAAREEPFADNSLGNITGSNSVNVFLGLGLPWAVAALYWGAVSPQKEAEWRHTYHQEPWYTSDLPVGFAVPAGSLGFSVVVFSVCAVLTLGILFLRRATLGVELGGDPRLASWTAGFFVLLWLLYVALSIWQESW